MTFTDSQLHAYLAGTLDADLSAALEERIGQDEVLEARLLTLDRAASASIRDAFDVIPAKERMRELAQPIEQAPKATDGRAGSMMMLAAAVAVLAVTLGLVLTTARPADRWQDQVAVYQALYVEGTLSPIRATDAELEEQLDRSAAALGRDLPLSAVAELDGLALLRAQLLGFEGVPLVQMAYLAEGGTPVAFCAIRLSGDENARPQFEELSGLSSVHWSDGTFSYMIVGDIPEDRLMRMAGALQAVL